MPEVKIVVTAVDDASGVLQRIRSEAEGLQASVGGAPVTPVGAGIVDAYGAPIKSAAGDVTVLTQATGEAGQEMGNAASQAEAFAGGATAASVAVKGANANVIDMGRSLKTAATFMLPFMAGDMFVKAEKSAIGFNEAMNQVGTLVHGNQALMQQWEAQILRMAPELGRTPTDLAKGLYEVLSVNTPVNEAMNMLALSAKAATAGQGDLFQTVQLLGGAMHAYGLDVQDVSAISDKLFEGIRTGSIRLADLQQSLGEVLPYSAQLGISLGDVTAAIVTLTNAGYQPAIAMTGLKELFVDLINQEKKFAAANIDIVADAKSGGITQVIKDLQTVTGGSIEKMKEFVPNIRALGPALTLAGSNSAAFNQHLAEMQKSAGETQTAFSQMTSGMSGDMNKLKAQSGDLSVQMGKNFDPHFILYYAAEGEKALDSFLAACYQTGTAIGNIFSAFVNAGDAIIDPWAHLFARIVASTIIFGHQMYNSGKALVKEFAQGIEDDAEKAYNAVKSVVSSMAKLLPHSPAEEGPLSTLDTVGSGFINTVAEGIINSGGTLAQATNTVLHDLDTAFRGGLNTIGAKGGALRGSSGTGSIEKLMQGYIQAESNLAFDRSVGAADELSQYGEAAYQAQVNAYQRLLGMGGIGSLGGVSVAGASSGGVNIILENVTINGANTSDPQSMAEELDEALAEKIDRGTSKITGALKSVGL